MQLNVEWRTGIGYGDFVTGLCYAHTSSIKYQIPVEITFHWNHHHNYLFHPLDPETLPHRCDVIHSTMKSNNMVAVSHKYNSFLKYRFFNQLDEFHPCHGLWYTNQPQETTNTVVLWTSLKNAQPSPFAKDPARYHWDKISNYILKSGFDVQEITYRTPVKEVLNLINKCCFGIGYDGLAHQLFKYLWKPLIVFCQRKELNRLLVPQASLEHNVEQFLKKGYKSYLEESNLKIQQFKQRHINYLNTKVNPLEHRLYNTPIY